MARKRVSAAQRQASKWLNIDDIDLNKACCSYYIGCDGEQIRKWMNIDNIALNRYSGGSCTLNRG